MTARRFTLVLTGDGHGMLTTPDDITTGELEGLRAAWKQWRETPYGVAIMGNTEVRTVTDIILDIVEPKEPVS